MSDAGIDARSVTVTLGGRQYVVPEAGFLVSRKWRTRFATEIKPLFEQLAGAAGVRFETPADLLQLAPLLDAVLVDGMDTIFELLLGYSDTLAADRAHLEAYATDRQILDAFREVASIALPFDLGAILTRQLGRAAIGTLSSLPSTNGVAPLSKPPRSQKRKSPG